MDSKLKKLALSVEKAIESGKVSDKQGLGVLKKECADALGISCIPADPDLLALLPSASSKVQALLGIKPVRTLSGVAPIAIMTFPSKCPHGTCVFCPGGPSSFFGNVPQSYTGREPASLRAGHNAFDPYLQTFSRLAQHVSTGHGVDKVELIVMGGTFPASSFSYQKEFVAYSFKALNDFGELFGNSSEFDRKKFFSFHEWKQVDSGRSELHEKLLQLKGKADLKAEQERNEKGNVRCVALCVETRPDFCGKGEVNEMLELGATRVEIGVQTVFDSVLRASNRGHSVQDSVEATRNAKDVFLKVVFHMMPGLPESSQEMDAESLSRIFSDANFKPDGLKVYPCLVMEGTALFEQWKEGKFEPILLGQAVELLAKSKKEFPRWVRVHRIERDIPSTFISAGVQRTNLRQYVHQRMEEKKWKCKCIRCREAGMKQYSGEWKLFSEKYLASEGMEYFISAESPDREVLAGFCRLRLPSQSVRSEISAKSAGVRELHVFHSLQPLGKKSASSLQHQGIGSALLQEAEKIAREELDARKLLVLSGIGVREYYKKREFQKDGAYVSKNLV
ncbi:MAG: tRNA uridine(34) 5-carboxymethylaminomethyl modification radical SAM/GNAT enzyme Elp3 [Candidatus Diapherotrites archaeon]